MPLKPKSSLNRPTQMSLLLLSLNWAHSRPPMLLWPLARINTPSLRLQLLPMMSKALTASSLLGTSLTSPTLIRVVPSLISPSRPMCTRLFQPSQTWPNGSPTVVLTTRPATTTSRSSRTSQSRLMPDPLLSAWSSTTLVIFINPFTPSLLLTQPTPLVIWVVTRSTFPAFVGLLTSTPFGTPLPTTTVDTQFK